MVRSEKLRCREKDLARGTRLGSGEARPRMKSNLHSQKLLLPPGQPVRAWHVSIGAPLASTMLPKGPGKEARGYLCSESLTSPCLLDMRFHPGLPQRSGSFPKLDGTGPGPRNACLLPPSYISHPPPSLGTGLSPGNLAHPFCPLLAAASLTPPQIRSGSSQEEQGGTQRP